MVHVVLLTSRWSQVNVPIDGDAKKRGEGRHQLNHRPYVAPQLVTWLNGNTGTDWQQRERELCWEKAVDCIYASVYSCVVCTSSMNQFNSSFDAIKRGHFFFVFIRDSCSTLLGLKLAHLFHCFLYWFDFFIHPGSPPVMLWGTFPPVYTHTLKHPFYPYSSWMKWFTIASQNLSLIVQVKNSLIKVVWSNFS